MYFGGCAGNSSLNGTMDSLRFRAGRACLGREEALFRRLACMPCRCRWSIMPAHSAGGSCQTPVASQPLAGPCRPYGNTHTSPPLRTPSNLPRLVHWRSVAAGRTCRRSSTECAPLSVPIGSVQRLTIVPSARPVPVAATPSPPMHSSRAPSSAELFKQSNPAAAPTSFGGTSPTPTFGMRCEPEPAVRRGGGNAHGATCNVRLIRRFPR
jgi:hypothetical protein